MSEIESERLVLRTVPRSVAEAVLANQPTLEVTFAPGWPSEFSLEVMQMVAGGPSAQQA
jgi:hypothetical protein